MYSENQEVISFTFIYDIFMSIQAPNLCMQADPSFFHTVSWLQGLKLIKRHAPYKCFPDEMSEDHVLNDQQCFLSAYLCSNTS